MGDDYSFYALADCYRRGRGCEKNDTLAFQWYGRAMEQGYIHAAKNLGDCYYYGRGVEKNIDKAIKFYRMAAEKGNRGAIAALSRLGVEI